SPRPRGGDQLRGISCATSVGWAADGVARCPDSSLDELGLPSRGQLRSRDHPSHRRVEGALLSTDREEHALDEGDADAAAANQYPSQQVQERPATAAEGDNGSLPAAQGEPDGRLLADDRAGPDLLCAVPGAVQCRRAAGRSILVLRLAQ